MSRVNKVTGESYLYLIKTAFGDMGVRRKGEGQSLDHAFRMGEMLKQGILEQAAHNAEDIEEALAATKKAFAAVKKIA